MINKKSSCVLTLCFLCSQKADGLVWCQNHTIPGSPEKLAVFCFALAPLLHTHLANASAARYWRLTSIQPDRPQQPQSVSTEARAMGEPIIASLVAGGLALTMLIWNWQMMEQQKRRGRRAFRDAAEAGAARAKSRAAAAKLVPTTAVATIVPRVVSSRSRVKLEALLECPANTPVGANPSPLFMKAVRERLETACLSPEDCADMPGSSGSPRAAGTRFFKDG